MKDGSRIFVALFDYDPPTMSPNPEACDDELAFSEGQLIKVEYEKGIYEMKGFFDFTLGSLSVPFICAFHFISAISYWKEMAID